jgi:predicted  nucleic acid-binding Zn-ribbon protein
VTHPLTELQAADTLANQLRHRRQHLPEHVELEAARSALARWQSGRDDLQRRIDELEMAIGRAEREAHQIDEHRAKLERQLKTVFASREAEALMREIATLKERRSSLDDAELEALEEQAQIDDQLSATDAEGEALRASIDAAMQRASVAMVSIDEEERSIAERHAQLRAAVAPELLKRYDSLRSHMVVAAAVLTGHRCSGCFLDLAPSELDDVRAGADADGVSVCPQCNRLLLI